MLEQREQKAMFDDRWYKYIFTGMESHSKCSYHWAPRLCAPRQRNLKDARAKIKKNVMFDDHRHENTF